MRTLRWLPCTALLLAAWGCIATTSCADPPPPRASADTGLQTPVAAQTPPPPPHLGKPASQAPVTSAIAVVTALRGQFRRCYVQSITRGPNLTVRATLVLEIDPTGAVSSATMDGDVPSDLRTCLLVVARSARFPPPSDGEPARILVPVVFVP